MIKRGKSKVGDENSAIYAAFSRHRSALKRFVSRFLASEADIEDITQEAFLKAFHAEQKKPIVKPKAFLFQVARNLALKELTKKSHQVTDLIEDLDDLDVISNSGSINDVENETQAREDLVIFCDAVATLPEQCRRVFLMRKVYGMSHKEIAGRLGIAVSTVEKHLVKGLKQCSTYMREEAEIGESGAARSMASDGQGVKMPVNEKT